MEIQQDMLRKFYTEEEKKKYDRILLVLKRLGDFLTLEEIINLKALNSYFHSHMNSPEFVYPLIYRILSILSATKVTEENCLEVFTRLTGLSANLKEVTQNMVNFKNLITNPYRKFDFKDWEVLHKGDGLAVEDISTYPPFKKIYAASNALGALKTTIDLASLNLNPQKNYYLAVGSPVARRLDCPIEAELSIEYNYVLYDRVITEIKKVYYQPEELETSSKCEWHWIGLSLKIDFKATTITVQFRGHNLDYWAGNFGPRFGYYYAFIVST